MCCLVHSWYCATITFIIYFPHYSSKKLSFSQPATLVPCKHWYFFMYLHSWSVSCKWTDIIYDLWALVMTAAASPLLPSLLCCWALHPGSCVCLTSTLTELHLPSVFVFSFWDRVFHPWSHNPPACWDYRHVLSHSSPAVFFYFALYSVGSSYDVIGISTLFFCIVS